ncbi:ATP-binding protein [Telmatocola sphagniphila]|uniref:ATP-binding protein n=1 Tax=Telmatocola sphagniphila TaxID=1123043 RepID=A0A8E6BA38_9BACT|nr:hypothetical protein [Telmatocola sphagniphila]QVL33185.1 ATP-binding protein [Telmatocola sphagniphila]
MTASATTAQAREKDPFLPALGRAGDLIAPRAPQTIESAALPGNELSDLLMRLAYTVPRFHTAWVSKQLHLSPALTDELLSKVANDGLIETLWQTSETSSHYKISEMGREHAKRLMDVCGYIGPAPVSLEAYSAMLRWQFANTPAVVPDTVAKALSNMVLSPKAAQLAGLGVSSGRSLFIYGPPGNGKSSLGRFIHSALPGDYWIPHAISVGETIIRLYDPQLHQKIEGFDKIDGIDQRWIRIRRPMVIVGGELTLDLLDLVYIPSMKFYEAPPHLKANGGVFLVDDFGRERISPEQLLNRFITPMEHQIDYFTLRTGQKLQMPLRHILIIATNLTLEDVTDPAFLRRMGYRIYLGAPTEEDYAKIFKSYAAKQGVEVGSEVTDRLLAKYREKKKELRACEPRDLIERSRDVCRFHGKPLELTPDVLDLAWSGYFGEVS